MNTKKTLVVEESGIKKRLVAHFIRLTGVLCSPFRDYEPEGKLLKKLLGR